MSSTPVKDYHLSNLTREIIQTMFTYQLPSGDWAKIAKIENTNHEKRLNKVPSQFISKPNVVGSLLSVNQLNFLQFKRFKHRSKKSWDWINKQFSDQQWFMIWPTGSSSKMQSPNIRKAPHVGYTALSGTISVFNNGLNRYSRRILYNLLNAPKPNILSIQNKKSGVWSNTPFHKAEDLYITAWCTEYAAKIWEHGGAYTHPYRTAYLLGMNWLRQELARNDYYFADNLIPSSYLTAMILLRIHHLLPQAFLANTLQNLIENSQYGTWVDESLPDTEREQSRYRTTICVLNLLTKPSIRFKFLKESALKASLDEFIFAKDVREYAEPRDLVFLLEIINNLFGRNTAKRLVNEYEIYDWWQPNNNLASSHYSEIKRLDEFYSRWLEEGEKRRLSLQYEAYSLGNGYRMALLEEQKQVKEVRTLLDRNLAQLNIRFFPKLDLPKARALGLPPHLLKRLRHALNKCSHINDLRHLRSLFFIDIRLRPWHDQLPEANNSLERTEKLIAFLYNKQHSETKANGLISLLEVLSERLDESDACYVELIQLIKELEDTI